MVPSAARGRGPLRRRLVGDRRRMCRCHLSLGGKTLQKRYLRGRGSNLHSPRVSVILPVGTKSGPVWSISTGPSTQQSWYRMGPLLDMVLHESTRGRSRLSDLGVDFDDEDMVDVVTSELE